MKSNCVLYICEIVTARYIRYIFIHDCDTAIAAETMIRD